MSQVILPEVESLLISDNFAQFATINIDGSPHIDTVWFNFQNGQIIIATTMATKKAKNIFANRMGFVVVTNKTNPYEQVQIKVELSSIRPDVNMKICDTISHRYIGKPFPQRHHADRVAIYLNLIKVRYHHARV